jgi:1-acyl-sn-glycerol-3-phosphate acyltransferase
MQNPQSLPPKPFAERFQPELTKLPKYNFWRWLSRRALWVVASLLVALRIRLTVRGLENFPKRGPGLIVLNHLGDADVVVIFSRIPTWRVDPLGASNLHDDYPWIGILGDLYGTIWLHRGHPDRRALACALDSLELGRFVSIAPEGRESLAGGLEEGLHGAAFLAIKADVPVIPIAVTGTENPRIANFTQWGKRAEVTMTVGKPFRLEPGPDRHANLDEGTERIMRELARLLPSEYQGRYREGENQQRTTKK